MNWLFVVTYTVACVMVSVAIFDAFAVVQTLHLLGALPVTSSRRHTKGSDDLSALELAALSSVRDGYGFAVDVDSRQRETCEIFKRDDYYEVIHRS